MMRPIMHKNKKLSYFTLIEITLAVFILAVGVCSILSIFPVAMGWGMDAMNSGTGSVVATSAISWLEREANKANALPIDSNGYIDENDSDRDGFIENIDVGNIAEGGYRLYYHFEKNSDPTTPTYNVQALDTTGALADVPRLRCATIKVFRRTKQGVDPVSTDDPIFTCKTFIFDKQ